MVSSKVNLFKSTLPIAVSVHLQIGLTLITTFK